MQCGTEALEANDIITFAGVFVGGLIAGLIGYKRKPPAPASTPVLTGLGMAYAEHDQMERLISEVKRIADAIGDKNAANINGRLEDLVERLDNMQTPPRRR